MEPGGDEAGAHRSVSSASISASRGGGPGVLNRDGRDTEDATTLAATYSIALGPGSLTLRAAQLVPPDHELALTALYTIPLGPRRSATAELLKRSGDYAARGAFRQTRGASDLGFDYRIAADRLPRQQYRGRVGYQSTLGAADLAVERFDGHNALRPASNGSLALVDGKVSPCPPDRSRIRPGEPAGLPGCPRLYRQPRGGPHRQQWPPAAAGAAPLQERPGAVDVNDLPLDAEVGAAEVEAVPFERSGMTIAFPLAHAEQATAVLHDRDGQPLPVGLRFRSANSAVTAWVARDGFSQVRDHCRRRPGVESEPGEAAYACELPPPVPTVAADLGTVRIR